MFSNSLMRNAHNDNSELEPIGLAATRLIGQLSKTSELAMMNTSRGSERSRGLIHRPECPETSQTSGDPDFRVPTAVLPTINTLQPGGCTSATVARVLLDRREPKIGDPVIIPIAVDVIEKRGRPLPAHIEPGKPMGEVSNAINANDPVTVARHGPGELAELCVVLVATGAPEKLARLRKVFEESPQLFGCDLVVQFSPPDRNEKQNEKTDGHRPEKQTPEERARDHREYIKRRLREIEAFERRASGHRSPAKRPV